MIHHGVYRVGEPPCVIEGNFRALIDCGCTVIVGHREDDGEVAAGMLPCCENHLPLGVEFNRLLKKSLAERHERDDMPLVEVCDIILQEAEVEFALGNLHS